MPSKLHQILAAKNDIVKRSMEKITGAYQTAQKHALFAGFDHRYQPLDDEGEQFPAERQRVQVTAADVLEVLSTEFTKLFAVNGAVDWGNLDARADVKIGDTVLLTAAPATYLLFLEKELTHLLTAVTKIPTLDPAETWTINSDGLFQSAPTVTNKSKKVPTAFVKAEATKEHPAQVDVIAEDRVVGTWTKTKTSGALPATEVAALADRVALVREAVKVARATANEAQVEQPSTDRLVNYVFTGE